MPGKKEKKIMHTCCIRALTYFVLLDFLFWCGEVKPMEQSHP